MYYSNWGDQHLVSSDLKKVLVARPGTQLSWLPYSAAVKRVTDCNILFLVDWECSLHKNILLHNTPFIFFKLMCSTWINIKRDVYFALDLTCVRNRKYKRLRLKISTFLADYFILICYSVSIVLDGTASNYLQPNLYYPDFFSGPNLVMNIY